METYCDELHFQNGPNKQNEELCDEARQEIKRWEDPDGWDKKSQRKHLVRWGDKHIGNV